MIKGYSTAPRRIRSLHAAYFVSQIVIFIEWFSTSALAGLQAEQAEAVVLTTPTSADGGSEHKADLSKMCNN